MVKIARPEPAFADVQVTSHNVEIFRTRVNVSRVTGAGIELAKEDCIACFPFQRKEFDPGASHGEWFPPALLSSRQKVKTGERRRNRLRCWSHRCD